jgi:ribosomal protein S18 acetylase RimI-like enzyme
MAVTLRAYHAAEFQTIYEIDRACYPRGIAYSRRTLQRFLALPGADCLLACVPEGSSREVAGFILTMADDSRGHIITIDVLERHRRSGIGTKLLLAAEQRMAARGVKRVTLETATSNAAGVAFWNRHGYRKVRVLPGYYLGRLDAFEMHKILTAGSLHEPSHEIPEET